MKHFLSALTLSSLFLNIPSTLATIQKNIYLPTDKTCAVYRGRIDHAQAFPMWIEKNRQLMIETNSELKVAVVFQNEVVSPYQIHDLVPDITSQYSYRTPGTGNHIISVQGKAASAKISFCLK
ncbi:hypothetical protein [Gloeothece verrucosa]|uniref:Uncharacterized protein n=1 Tax=Gloeothece verrucosa (strain PCC 7822) TaxID=497965 RepID=E0UBS5_GLOV7|nr:hypothetical protein [Gloeothece verrucosa]ADN15140.1 conserved hypothetical protein [Gloeothece verrucosa PCC 7822]